jgi:hypothetical protein
MKHVGTGENLALSELATSHLPKVLLKVFQEKCVFDNAGKENRMHSNFALFKVAMLYNFVRHLKPFISAEGGFAEGISTLGIVQALLDDNRGIHHMMDPFHEMYADAGHDRATWLVFAFADLSAVRGRSDSTYALVGFWIH